MKKENKNPVNGYSFIELTVAIAVISFLFTMAIPSFDTYFQRMELNNAIRTVTGVLNNARYNAIMLNKPVKFSIQLENNEYMIRLSEKQDKVWLKISEYKLEKNISACSNASPVFYPTGSVSPLCSILIGNDSKRYKITISIAGRIKVVEMTE